MSALHAGSITKLDEVDKYGWLPAWSRCVATPFFTPRVSDTAQIHGRHTPGRTPNCNSRSRDTRGPDSRTCLPMRPECGIPFVGKFAPPRISYARGMLGYAKIDGFGCTYLEC